MVRSWTPGSPAHLHAGRPAATRSACSAESRVAAQTPATSTRCAATVPTRGVSAALVAMSSIPISPLIRPSNGILCHRRPAGRDVIGHPFTPQSKDELRPAPTFNRCEPHIRHKHIWGAHLASPERHRNRIASCPASRSIPGNAPRQAHPPKASDGSADSAFSASIPEAPGSYACMTTLRFSRAEPVSAGDATQRFLSDATSAAAIPHRCAHSHTIAVRTAVYKERIPHHEVTAARRSGSRESRALRRRAASAG